ncbi:MAG TPA: hypothetical protein VGG74_15000 [Kofleriaceae bacterium]
MRWLVVLLAGCSFNAARSSDAGNADATRQPLDSAQSGSGSDGSGSGSGSGSSVTIAAVQGSSGASATSVLVLVLPQAVVAGDTCVVGLALQSGSISSVADSGGDHFVSAATLGSQTVYVAAGMAASATETITVTFSGYTGYADALEVYRGLATTSIVDASAAASGDSALPDSGAAQTSHPFDLLVGVAASDGTMVAGNGYAARQGGSYSLIEDEQVSATGSYHATAVAGGSVEWSMVLLALEAAD